MNLETLLKILNIEIKVDIKDILDSIIIYLRKSRKDMEYFKDESIEKTLKRHEEELQEWAKKIFGFPIPEKNIYREVASGDTIDDRPIMQEVLSIIESSKIKGVLCLEIERLARGNTIDQGMIAQTFKFSDTKILTPFKIYNLENEDDLSYFEDGLYQARKYLVYTKKILSRGRKRSVLNGCYVGSILPYGYDKIKLQNEKGYKLIPNEIESKIVNLIFELWINGLDITYTIKGNDTISSVAKLFGISQKQLTESNNNISFDINGTCKIIISNMGTTNISNYLNYIGIKPRNSKHWTANCVRNILRNITLNGYLTWERRKTVKTLANGTIVKTNPISSDFTIVRGLHDPIIKDDTWKLAQEKIKNCSTKTIPIEKELKNPLVGLIKCSVCGRNMTRRPYYLKKENNSKFRRVYEIDKNKLRLLLREHKKNLSLRDISNKLNISKFSVDRWFSNNLNSFCIPYHEKWFELKELLNITTDEFDKALTTLEKSTELKLADTIICSLPKCKCVGSDLKLVENHVLKALELKLEEYNQYINNFEEEFKKENILNKSLFDIIENEITKTKIQIDKACELVETGAYNQSLFLKRTATLNEQLKKLNEQKEELTKNSISKKFIDRKNGIPIIKKVLKEYKENLTATQKNYLLSLIIEKILYEKNKGGRNLKDNFYLNITLLF